MSSRFGSDGYTNSQRKQITGVLQTTIERDKEAIEAMQQRLEDLGSLRMTDEELDAMAAGAPLQAPALPQPEGAGATASLKFLSRRHHNPKLRQKGKGKPK